MGSVSPSVCDYPREWPWPRRGESKWGRTRAGGGGRTVTYSLTGSRVPFSPGLGIIMTQPPLTPTTLEGFDAAWVKHVMSDWFLKYVWPGCSLCPDKNNIPIMLRNDFPVESVNVLRVSASLNSLQVKSIKNKVFPDGLLPPQIENKFLDFRAFWAQPTKWKWPSAWKMELKSKRASLSRC